MTYEVEQKFPVADTVSLERDFILLGAHSEPPVEQIDQYFAHPARDFAKTDEALRIRRVGDQNRLTYKGPKIDTTTKTRREIELAFEAGQSGFDQLAEMLTLLGFRPVATVRKIRRPYQLRWENREFEVALDDVTSVGTFVELELVVGESDLEAAKVSLRSLSQKLGLQQVERRSYLELLLERSTPSNLALGAAGPHDRNPNPSPGFTTQGINSPLPRSLP